MTKRGFLILLLAFLASLAVRAPHIGRPLSAHHEYCTALVLIFLENWRDGGFAEHKSVPTANFRNAADRHIHPYSYAFAVREGALYYLSHAPLAYYLPFAVLQITGFVPDERWLTWFNLIFHFTTLLLLFLVVKECTGDPGDDRPDLPIITSLLYLFMPAPLWFHGNAYMADMFVQNTWVLHLLTAVILFRRGKPHRPWILVGYAVSLLLVVFTNWLGVFVGVAGAAAAFYFHRKDKQAGWNRVILWCVFAVVAGLGLTVMIYANRLGTQDLFTYLWYRFQDRATMQFWEGGIQFHLSRLIISYRLGWSPVILLILILLIIAVFRRFRALPGPGLQLFFLLTLLPVVLDHAVFLKYAGHDFAALKAGFFLCGLAAWLLDGTASMIRHSTRVKWGAVAVTCMIGVLLFFHYNPPTRNYDRHLIMGRTIARVAAPDEVVFAMGFTPEPQEQWYAKRNLKQVGSMGEAQVFLIERNIESGVVFMPAGDSLAWKRITR